MSSPGLLLAGILAGCDPAPPPRAPVPADTAEEATPVDCTGVPRLTWDGWADGFFATWCRSCHGAGAPDRHGAPAGVDFDTEAQVGAWGERVRVRALDEGTMPMGGGVPSAELAALDAWLSCGVPSEGGTTPEVDTSPVVPAWDGAQAAAALDAALAGGLPAVEDIRTVYLDFFAHGDAICPGHDDFIDDTWLYGCRSDLAWYFSGVSEYSYAEDPAGTPRTRAWHIFGDLYFEDDLMRAFEGGGDAWSETRVSAASASRWTRHLGTWSYAGHAGLLGPGVSGLLDIELVEEAGVVTATVDGAARFADTSLRFDQVVLTEAGGCAGAPTGRLSVRDPETGWHRVDLGQSCRPCGDAVYDGRIDEGEVCPDLSAVWAQVRADAAALRAGEAR